MPTTTVFVLDVSTISYEKQVCAAALQGLVNGQVPQLFLDYGIYDDPLARRTNEVFLDDQIWFGKFRQILDNQDRHNLAYYQSIHDIKTTPAADLDQLINHFRSSLKGFVVWDAALPDTVNVAVMLAAQENLLPIEANMLPWAKSFELGIVHDLRGRWTTRIELYRWAFENLFDQCKTGQIACIEPGWQRPEFIDYVVQNRIFTYNLSSQQKGPGQTLLLLLAFGPAWLRELIFSLGLDRQLRWLALTIMKRTSPEIRLQTQIQKSVKSETYPTIFGWHTKRDYELTFMMLLSANGLRLVPSHMASNFSFHASVPPKNTQLTLPTAFPIPALDSLGTYLTFSLSDGDQLMMMSTAELGSWRSPQRGQVPFNWETQPLLAELAPALFEKFIKQATPNDCLIAGPSGAGYIIPPLAPHLLRYIRESNRVCSSSGIRVITSYVADPPRRILRQLCRQATGIIGYLSGYAVMNRTPQTVQNDTVFIANRVPTINQLWDSAEDLLASIKKLAQQPTAECPRFIGIHLFAYRTSYQDVANFVVSLNDPHIHIVRADTFLQLAKLYLEKTES